MTKCTLPKVDQVEVTCVLDEPWLCRNWTSSNKRWMNFSLLQKFVQRLHWGEETSTEEEEETEQPTEGPSKVKVEEKMNPNITFRQVSGFHFNKVEYFITFNSFGLTNDHLDVEYYSIMDLHLIFKGR